MRMNITSNSDERELSLFLYNLTQEIVASRDYSDCNITRICATYYETSNYPDKDRLRRLIADLKRKLRLDQSHQHISVSTQAPEVPCKCDRCREETEREPPPAPLPMLEHHVILDKCVGTQSLPTFFPGTALVRVAETVPLLSQESHQTYETVTPCATSAGTMCSLYSVEPTPRKDPSEESETLIEQILLRHRGLVQDTSSSDVLLRVAAADRMLCDSCHGKCPLQRCQPIIGRSPHVAGPSCGGRSGCASSVNRPMPRKECKCPLRQCGHFAADDGGGGGAGGCSGCASDAPILRQATESVTPPITCCGKRKRRKQPVACRERSGCRGTTERADPCRK